MKQIKKLEPAGSLRRRKETIGDIDILCTVDDPSKSSRPVMERFVKLPMAKAVLAKGETKSSVRVEDDVQVDLRVVNDNSFGAAMMYFTGSKDHNIAMRTRALKMGWTINEYGLFKVGSNRPVAGKTECEVFEKLKLQYIPPELRECRGEIEAAEKKQLPMLIELSDIKGDLHVHSTYSDGAGTIDEIADEAEKRGYEWIAITDHSQSLKIANGLEPERLIQKIEEIKKYNKENKKVRILCGTEVDIMNDGSLDYDDDLLSRLDIVVAAIHSGFKQSKEILTKRIVRAMKNKYVHVIAHPTGRHFGKREPYELDMTEIFHVALETGTALEINAHPVRLDLPDFYCQKAVEKGVPITIGTDAHASSELEYMKLGVSVARRGWLSKNNIWNSCSYSQLAKILGRKKGVIN
jgi:DNA polymerase (family 10)